MIAATALAVGTSAGAQTIPDDELAPPATCRPGDNPEVAGDLQGRVPAAAYEDGVEQFVITCNTDLVGRHGDAGGFKVQRYVDAQGQECAYYDTTIIFGADLPAYLGFDPEAGPSERRDPGTYVLDMSDPANPTQTATLVSPAFQSPHESMLLHEGRGILAAALGNPVTYPGQVDLYDVSQDCTNPELLSSLPVGTLGHESGFSPDGNTFWVASLWTPDVTAVDITNPRVPVPLWNGDYYSHGISVSPDGNRAYLSWFADLEVTNAGLMILDVTDIQNRTPLPAPTEVSITSWDNVSTPQMSIHVTFDGVPHLIQVDEFGLRDDTGAGRIIDISDETNPVPVGPIRLEVNQNSAREELSNDPGYNPDSGGYTAHYCSVPTVTDPKIVACSFILSGLRIFDITDITAPREVAYFNVVEDGQSPYAMSSVAFDPDEGHLWYSDGESGLWVVDVDDSIYAPGGAMMAGGAAAPTQADPTTATTSPSTDGTPAADDTASGPVGQLPATGGAALPVLAVAALAVFGVVRRATGRGGRS